MATSTDDVVWLIEIMTGAGAHPIVAGGWGVDALVGTQTRPHRDVDVLVQDEFVAEIVNTLVDVGFVVATNWLPVRIELSDAHKDRHVDIHPVFGDGLGGWSVVPDVCRSTLGTDRAVWAR